ncbi:MAG: 6-hydroxymethylpterin diphosphokinase MptE-like protein [Myxococcota bacterium]
MPSESTHTEPHEILPSTSGKATLRIGDDYLEGRTDPDQAARDFVESSDVEAEVVVLFGTGLGYRPKALLAAGVERLTIFEPRLELVDAFQREAPEVFAQVTVISERAPMIEHLIRASFAGDRTVLLVPPAYRRAFPKAHAELMATLNEAEGLKQLRKNTFMERYNLILEAALRNLPNVADVPFYHTLGKPLEGLPAFIVSAGPSLDKNGELLVEASKRGAIFTVNTAAPAVTTYGAPIDVLTCVEAMDVTPSLGPAASNSKILALDLSANPKNHAVDVAQKVAFMPGSDPFHTLSAMLDTPILAYGASVATAAFALARAWGADPIVLVGQDLAYTGGQVYAKHTGRGGMTAHDRGRFLELEYSDEMLATFRSHGVKTPPRVKPAVRVPAWGGGEIATAHDMVLFLRWFETVAYDLRGKLRLINATEGGVRIEGFEERRLEEVIAEFEPRSHRLHEAAREARGAGTAKVERVRQDLVKTARAIAKAARRCNTVHTARQQRKADLALRKLSSKSKFVDVHCAPILLKVREDKELAFDVRRRRTFEAIEASAKRIAKLAS